MPDEPILALTHADTRDFLRGMHVTMHDGAPAEELLRNVFNDRQAQQAAFVALADCGLDLVPLEH